MIRLIHINENSLDLISHSSVSIVGMNLGTPRKSLTINFGIQDSPEGLMFLSCPNRGNNHDLVCQGGMLSYFQSYVERLERGVYEPFIFNRISSGISLFPALGDGDDDTGGGGDETRIAVCSRVVTNGIEVRASSRWFPEYGKSPSPMNFGYSIRIHLLPAAAADGSYNGAAMNRTSLWNGIGNSTMKMEQ